MNHSKNIKNFFKLDLSKVLINIEIDKEILSLITLITF